MKRIAVMRPTVKLLIAKNLLQDLNVRLLPTLHKEADCFRHEIVPGLAAHGVFLRHWEDLYAISKRRSQCVFRQTGFARSDTASDPPRRIVSISLQSLHFSGISD